MLIEAPISVETHIVVSVLRHLRDIGQEWPDAEPIQKADK